MRMLSGILLLSGCLLVAGCGSSYQAPVGQIEAQPRFIDTGRTHRVNDGETLYAIAWMYDLDFSDLARANNISDPGRIFAGQILTVDLRYLPPPSQASSPNTSASPDRPASASTSSRPEVARQPEPTRQTPINRPASVASGPITWGWPYRGRVIRGFAGGGTDNKGIDIAGTTGDSIVAAAAGEVVYAGSGLLRYGDLIIVKHSDRFLSAYAHNSLLVVKEGDVVRAGQKIAELGSTGIDTEMLHFEIRLDGKPVDPIRYLPPR